MPGLIETAAVFMSGVRWTPLGLSPVQPDPGHHVADGILALRMCHWTFAQ
jgi:hypothetical protein